MLIVCPSCASEYTIDPERVGTNGRAVRCAACRATWVVAAPAIEAVPPAEPFHAEGAAQSTGEAEADLNPIAAVEDEPAPEPVSAAAVEPESISVEAESRRAAEAALPEPEIKAPRKRGQKTLGALKFRQLSSSRRGDRTGPWLAVLTLGIVATAVLARAPLVRLWPETAALYALVGLPVNLSGLDLKGVKAEFLLSGAEAILLIEGDILNPTGRALPVPRIEFAVRGADGQPLYTWTNDAPRGTLGPSETARFHAKLASPPAEGRQVLVRFAPAADGPAVAAKDP
jgi:predicted Zn finger-like uncharacterized protein